MSEKGIIYTEMDVLIKETLKFMKQEFSPNETFLVTAQDSEKQMSFPTPSQEKTPPPMTEEHKPTFSLEPLTKPKQDEMEALKALLSKVAPNLPLALKIPDDAKAKKIANLWKEHLNTAEVIFLSYGQTGQELKFLQNLTQAVNTLLVPAKLIDATRFEKENKWQLFFSTFSLKLIVAPDRHVWTKTNLSSFYRENPASHLHFLEKTPLLLLAPISHYLKNPLLKKQLWKSIVSHLSS